ncbi:MAG: HAD family phosphatase [Chloroflexota bacterium]|nr:MAG: HAD family phosphatase [Chloroflexota bacterium]
MNKIQGVLWDMDGVLVDTGEAHFESWQLVLAERGLPFDRELFQATFGMNNTGILQMVIDEHITAEEVQIIGDRKEALFRQAVKGNAQLLPGVLEWLIRLKNQNIPQAVASSAPQANIDALVGELKLGAYFAAIVSGAGMPGKPDPDVFLEAARQIGVPADGCVVVEDAIAGVQAALNAGMRCVAVTTTNSADALASADIVVDRLDRLTEETFFSL